MNKIFLFNTALIVIVSGCGALNHSKNASPAHPASGVAQVQKPNPESGTIQQVAPLQSPGPLTLNNLDSGPHEWDFGDKKLTIIGTFSRSELNSIMGESQANIRRLGTLRANWHALNYPAHVESDDPKSISTDSIVDYPKTDAYLIQFDDQSETVSIAIMESKYADLEPKNNDNFEVQYNDQIICDHLVHTNLYLPNLPLVMNCDGFSCTSSLGGDITTKPYDSALLKSPECTHRSRKPTQKGMFNNTANITEYEVRLIDEFLQEASELKFSATK
jgi:uncharacterized protein YdeI (BOF family)